MRRDECSEQEQWVLEQLELGKIADLKSRFGITKKRRLGARFLEALFTDDITMARKFTPKRKGIRIAQAVIVEAIGFGKCQGRTYCRLR